MPDLRKAYGYPDEYQIPSRNRQYSNQPGHIAEPEQEMARDFSPEDPQSDHMRSVADELRKSAQGYDMDYLEANQPLDDT